MTSYLYAMIFVMLLTVCWSVAAENNEFEMGSSGLPEPLAQILADAAGLQNQNQTRDAIKLLQTERINFDNHPRLVELEVQLLLESGRLSEAKNLIEQLPATRPDGAGLLVRVQRAFETIVSSEKRAIIFAQKRIELKDFETAIAVTDLALLAFPDQQADFFTLKGEALYKMNALEAAESEFMRALQIDPLNPVAKSYVTEIRTTLEAQTSTALAEWIRIAKDKVGDFIVTFLALFTAFLMNSLLSPLSMRFRLLRARRAFEAGNYDGFADAVERLLDQEDFKPLRHNFRLLLRKRPYEEVKAIFEAHVMTEERLPTLLRILHREHDRMLADA
jgi:tetratricopeptide (TPR) repeat protein